MSDLLLGVVQVISSPLIPPGRAYLVKAPIGYETTPMRALEFEPPRFDVPLSYRYGFEMRFPKPSAVVMATNYIERRTSRQMWRDLMARGERFRKRRQRRLDYRSNVRRRKRWAELRRRRNAK